MMKPVLLILGFMTGAWGCSSPLPPPDHLPSKLVVLPVNNRTGDDLIVSGEGVLDRHVFHTPTTGLAEILEAEAGFQLREKGFEVPSPLSWDKRLKGRTPQSPEEGAELAARAGLGPLGVYVEIRRWEPEGRAHINSVIVDLEAVLVEVASRKVLWRSERHGPIPTPGQFLLGSAYVAAARKVITDLIGPLSPER